MIVDNFLVFSDGQAITTTAVSTNVLDMLNARDIGIGDSLKIAVDILTTFTGGTSMQVQLQASADNSTYYTITETRAILLAELVAGRQIKLDVQPKQPGDVLPRYYRLNYVVVGTMAGGTVQSEIIKDRRDNISYPAGINTFN